MTAEDVRKLQLGELKRLHTSYVQLIEDSTRVGVRDKGKTVLDLLSDIFLIRNELLRRGERW